jgi:L-fuconolactonase
VVFVQCECLPEQHLDELRWVQSLADADPRIAGIVPWAPLEAGDDVHEELVQIAADPRVKGIRRIIQFEDDVDFCARAEFVRGVQLLADVQLHFEITIASVHMPNALKLIDQCPQVRFILDHIGNPNIRSGQRQPWATHMKAIGGCDGVYCKVSNFACNADLENWKRDDFVPYFETVVETFGHDRIIWAGDWPHALRAIQYVEWVQIADWMTRHWSKEDRYKLFHDNAVQFYRLGADR